MQITLDEWEDATSPYTSEYLISENTSHHVVSPRQKAWFLKKPSKTRPSSLFLLLLILLTPAWNICCQGAHSSWETMATHWVALDQNWMEAPLVTWCEHMQSIKSKGISNCYGEWDTWEETKRTLRSRTTAVTTTVLVRLVDMKIEHVPFNRPSTVRTFLASFHSFFKK